MLCWRSNIKMIKIKKKAKATVLRCRPWDTLQRYNLLESPFMRKCILVDFFNNAMQMLDFCLSESLSSCEIPCQLAVNYDLKSDYKIRKCSVFTQFRPLNILHSPTRKYFTQTICTYLLTNFNVIFIDYIPSF